MSMSASVPSASSDDPASVTLAAAILVSNVVAFTVVRVIVASRSTTGSAAVPDVDILVPPVTELTLACQLGSLSAPFDVSTYAVVPAAKEVKLPVAFPTVLHDQ